MTNPVNVAETVTQAWVEQIARIEHHAVRRFAQQRCAERRGE